MTEISATAFFRAAGQPTEWFHGSGAAFDRFDMGKNKTVQDDDDAKHWNSHLGAHFTSDHRVAQEFAQRQDGGHVYHAQLDLQNPKHYDSEHDLDREAVHWAHGNGHDMGPSFSNPAYRAHTEPDEWQFHIKYDDHGAPRPEARAIAHGFRDHLKAQGHDGITYGNEFEGADNGFHAGERHLSAIAFHPDQIAITQRHGGNETHEPRTASAFFRTATAEGEWYHGTPNSTPTTHFNFDQERSYQDKTGLPRYWNSHLGAHFTSVHDVAREVSTEWGHRGGHITHARLDMANPKHYRTEDDMDNEAFDWAEKNGHDPMAHRDKNVLHGVGGLLTVHPQAREIAHGFRDHLKSQGHDSITYGNTIEGPYAHKCAIAFHPDQIHVTGTHGINEPCPPGGHTATAAFREAAEGPKTYRWTQTYQGPNGYEDRENSIQGPLYHGGGARLRDGQQIKPGRKPNAWGDDHGKSQHVYFTTNRDTAADYARRSGGHVFQVEPTGDFRMDHNEGEFKTQHPLTVTRRLDPEEWHGNGDGTRTAGRGKPRRQPRADEGAAGAGQDAAGGAPSVGSDQGGDGPVEPREVTFHPAAKKEMGKLDAPSRKQVAATIDALAQGGENLQSHQLRHPLKGWMSTKASRGHRVIHRDLDDGTLHVGYVGLHEYETAERRLGSLTAFFRMAVNNGWHQNPDEQHITRGVEIEPTGGWHPDVAHRIINGTATHHDVLSHVNTDRVGHYWSTHNLNHPGGLDFAKEYAEPHEPMAHWQHDSEPGEHVLGAAGVVLVGHRPHGWNPDDNDEEHLMGNSTIPEHSHIPLHEIHYSADGETWHKITPPAGTTVHNDGPPHTATSQLRETAGVDDDGKHKEAAAVDHSDGVMVAFVPPREIAEQIAVEGGQPVEELHVTLAYLGDAADYTPEQLAWLPELVSSWAARQKPVGLRIGGVTKFNNADKDEHVLCASVDIPGGAQLHSSLSAYLEGHGYRLPSEHGWTPHLTLSYVDKHFRFMPHLDAHRWSADFVCTEIGTARHQARLGTLPSGTTAL